MVQRFSLLMDTNKLQTCCSIENGENDYDNGW